MMKTDRKILKFIACMIVCAFILGSGCTQPSGTPPGQVTPEETKTTPSPTPTATVPDTPVTVSVPDTTRVPATTQTTKPTLTPTSTPTRTPTITLTGTSDTASYFCTGDTCGTLMVSLTCNPRILFRRMAILKLKNPANTTERSAAVAAMGNNYANILPDGSVLPVPLHPGRYTLVLLNERNVQVPETGVVKSMATVYVSTGKITTYEFKQECR